jgi:hypothetical protein
MALGLSDEDDVFVVDNPYVQTRIPSSVSSEGLERASKLPPS